MKFSVERQTILEAVQTVSKVISKRNLTIPEIGGILINVNENSGLVTLTGTDIRTYIQRRLNQCHIEEGGAIIAPVCISDMIKLATGEIVIFETKQDTLKIISGTAIYEIACINAEGFPKIGLSFPQDTICVKGLNTLIKRTCFAIDLHNNEVGKEFMHYIKINCSEEDTRAQATNGACAAVSRSPHCADGKLEMILHGKAIQILDSIVDSNDELFVGISGAAAVFMKSDLIFSTLMFQGQYIESTKLLQAVHPVYRATVDAKDFYFLLEHVTAILSTGDDPCVNVQIKNNQILAQVQTISGISHSSVPAINTIESPEQGFYYQPKLLLGCVRQCSGPMDLLFDQQGFLIIEANQSRYFVGPRSPVHISQKQKSEKQTTKSKKKVVKQSTKEVAA
ncbi:beta clamp domain-containing protein [Massiliimalia massiliensis]|uniref:hypothetical protein n=1 Tax=Massiliimalia massiliensis TaxID=1852384 RepID=UPI000985A313|nr:hypothetical protein [Massiliimalia massiliensis]